MNSSQLNFLNRYEKRKFFDVGENGIRVSQISKKLINGISGLLLKDESPEVKEHFACLFAIQNTDARYITALIPETVKTITSVTRLSELPENEQIAVKEATGRDFAFLAFKAGKIMQRKSASADLKRFASFFYNPKAAKNLGAFLHLPEDADNIFIVNGSIVVVALYGYDNIQNYENRFGKGRGAGSEVSSDQGVSDGEWQDYHPFQDYIADDENFDSGTYQPEEVSCSVPESDVLERSEPGTADELDKAERNEERDSDSSFGHNESSGEFNLNESDVNDSFRASNNSNEGCDTGGSEYSETQDVSEGHSEMEAKSGCLFPFGKNGSRKSGDGDSEDAADSEKSSDGSSSGNGNSGGKSGDELSSDASNSGHGGGSGDGHAAESGQDFSFRDNHFSDDSSRQFSGNADVGFEASNEFGGFGNSSDRSEESDSANSFDSEKSSDSDKSSESDRSSDSDKSSDSDESYDSDQSFDSKKYFDSDKSSDSDSSSDTDISHVSDESSESSVVSEDNSQTVIISEKETSWWKGCFIAFLILLALLLIIALIYWLLCLYVWKTDPAQIFITPQKPETVVVEKGGDSSPVPVNSDGNQPASGVHEVRTPGPEQQQGTVSAVPAGTETPVAAINENISDDVTGVPASELSPAGALQPVSSLTDNSTQSNVAGSDSSKEYSGAEIADYSSDQSNVREFDEGRSRDSDSSRESTASSENQAQDAGLSDTASGSEIVGPVPVSVPEAMPEESRGSDNPVSENHVPENPQTSPNKGLEVFEWRVVTRGKTIDGKTVVDFNLTSRDKRISCNSRGYLTRNEALKADEYEVQKVLIGRDCGRFDLDYMPQKITCYDKDAPFCQINSFSESKARSGKEDNLYLLNPYLKMNK
ncbi:hypothetical protein [Succinimonas sp.]|uniref:hypothetical protein n=1 Tax=Succinimonas sp. TaxID=1936151 RepID=UPI00386FA001